MTLVLRKPRDRPALIRDAEYFANELERRLEALQRVEPTGHVRAQWAQAAGLSRRIRGLAREQQNRQPRRTER